MSQVPVALPPAGDSKMELHLSGRILDQAWLLPLSREEQQKEDLGLSVTPPFE